MQTRTALLRLAYRLKQGYAAALQPVERTYGLTRNEIDVLLFLANNPDYDTARDMVELLGLSKSHVCKSVDRLTRLGFLSGRTDRTDRRLIRLTLLPGAEAAVRAAQIAQQAFFDGLYRGVTQEEQAVLDGVLEKLAANLEEEPPLC